MARGQPPLSQAGGEWESLGVGQREASARCREAPGPGCCRRLLRAGRPVSQAWPSLSWKQGERPGGCVTDHVPPPLSGPGAGADARGLCAHLTCAQAEGRKPGEPGLPGGVCASTPESP